tara:strand:+ start:1160 stop:2323 length:1164 start_codon:yes stop_codon:yes gene_type:complete
MKKLFLIPLLIIISCDETTNDEVSLIGTWNITSLKYYSNPDCTGDYEELSGTITFNQSSGYEELVSEYSFQEYCQEVGGSYDGENCIVGDGSLFFDGDDYVEVPHNESLNISDRNGNEGTLMAYIKIADASEVTYNRIISKKSIWNAPTGYELEVNPSQNIITFLAGDDNFARGELVPTDDWMHVAVVFQDTVATIYVNGVDATFDYNINPVSSDEVPLWIGNLTGSADDPEGGAFNGHIDEIGILDIALTGDEVRNIIANGFEINSNVAAYWDFGSGSGVQLVDQSSNANNGAITGAAWAIDSPNQSPMDENSFSQLCTATGGEYSENSCVISTTNYWNYRLNLNEYCEMDSTGEYSYCGTLQLSPTEATITISNDDGCMILNCSR